MRQRRPKEKTLIGEVRKHLPGHGKLVLAVSGGMDSMVLLDAIVRAAPERIAAVATFDHRTGPFGARAVRLVRGAARARDLAFVSGRSPAGLPATEAAWRAARWSFLRTVARDADAAVVTAHTRDDQVETVVLRILRGAGARGLAGLYAPSDVVRPLLHVSRAQVQRYAQDRGVDFAHDPTNDSRAFLRNRVRHDLLPALMAATPRFDVALRGLARRAGVLRRAVARVVDQLGLEPASGGAVRVATAVLEGYDLKELRVLGPEIAGRAGITLDRRGTERLALFILNATRDGVIPLSGGVEVAKQRGYMVFRRSRRHLPSDALVPLQDGLEVGEWRFRRVRDGVAGTDVWCAAFPSSAAPVVRVWRAGDRMVAAGAGAPRRVKRFFRDSGIPGTDRGGWPVVLLGEEIVWIPGVRHGPAGGSGGDGAVRYVCERVGG